MFVFILYIPPSAPASDYQVFLDIFSTIEGPQSDRVMMLGDFNAPNFLRSTIASVRNFSHFHNLSQHSNIPNKLGCTLDLIFSSYDCTVERSENVIIQKFNFKRANYPLLCEQLSSQDWSSLDNLKDVNDACSFFIIVWMTFSMLLFQTLQLTLILVADILLVSIAR